MMAYEKKTWETGDTIFADDLNHMEDGIAALTNAGQFFTSGVDIQSNTDVNKADVEIPAGVAPAVNDIIIDTAGDLYRITAVADMTVHVSNALAVNLKGPKGDTGVTGAAGKNGADGAKGDTGAQGPKGDTGATGSSGAKGDKGDPGAAGKDGAKGDSGLTIQAAEADLAANADLAATVSKVNTMLAKMRAAGVIADS